MVLLFSPTGLLEIAVFVLAILAFVLAIRFFVDSRKRLEALFPDIVGQRKLLPFGMDRSGFLIPKNAPHRNIESNSRVLFKPAASSPASDGSKDEIKALRAQVQQQQQELSKALQQMAHFGEPDQGGKEKNAIILNDQKKLEGLRLQLEKKESEIQRLRQQEQFSQKLQERFETLQSDFNDLQEKMMEMEQQAWQAAELTLQLEHTRASHLQLEKNLLKKEEKLQEVTMENLQFKDSFHDLEEQLAQANLQRQQLQKKMQFLEDVNADMLHMAETNRKLVSEISRVAELESMLQLVTEERNALLRRR